MKKIRSLTIISLFLSLFFLNACKTRELNITTDPPGALITYNRHYLGESPITYTLKERPWYHNVYEFTAIKEGYWSETIIFKEKKFSENFEIVPQKIHLKMHKYIPGKKKPLPKPLPKPDPKQTTKPAKTK